MMNRADPLALALGMPKAELHIHIEGSLEPGLAFALARRNGVALPYADEAALKAAYAFDSLQSFLDLYYACAAVLQTRADFRDLMLAYLERAAADGVVHAEIFFDPQTHTARGVPFATVLDGLDDGLAEGARRWGISGRLIMCFLRHLSEDECLAALAEAEPFIGRIHGFGLDSSERGHPPAKFARLFARCRALGKPVVAHAGEEGPPAYVWEALDVLNVDRIDHGNRALEDSRLVDRLREEQMTLTVCPLSNLSLCVVKSLDNHPLQQMLKLGLRATINSDDPAYFGGYVGANIAALALTEDEKKTLARNSFLGSFLPEAEKQKRLAALDA
ncbi:MAG: Adenine deaminase [Alphaproteobacteria bacterium ADurb.BinA305]|nr:MAG: Adenine deaminase [Alphaproteobacteria bacterium ADurb.BinA305]